jgi:branched-subunit amino acid transport protein
MSSAEFWLAAALMSAATYATRLPGLLLRRAPRGAAGRGLAATPPAVFAALALPPLLLAFGPGGPTLALSAEALLAAVATAVAAGAARRFDVALLAGLAAASVARLAGL